MYITCGYKPKIGNSKHMLLHPLQFYNAINLTEQIDFMKGQIVTFMIRSVDRAGRLNWGNLFFQVMVCVDEWG